MKSILTLLTITLLGSGAFAHPVAFKGSTGIMGAHSSAISHNQFNRSFEYWLAAGVHHLRRPLLTENDQANFATANLLLKRWYGDAYQGNLYAVLGAGMSEFTGEQEPVGFGLVQFDIEDRKYYFLTKHARLQNEAEREFEQSVVRAGIAPYVGGYGDIHSWLILEWENTRFLEEDVIADVTPFLRVFHRNILFEIGYSVNGVAKLNYISHF